MRDLRLNLPIIREPETKTKNFLLKISCIIVFYHENKNLFQKNELKIFLFFTISVFSFVFVLQICPTPRDTGERIFTYGTLLIFGGQNMKIIKKNIYPHKSQTILNTLAKNSLINSIPEVSCMGLKIYSR